jgi:uncharacterized membrane protein YkoI
MKAVVTRRTLLLALALSSTGVGLAYGDNGDDSSDHDRASRAVAQGRAQPLAQLLNQVQARLGGQVIGVKLKQKNGRFVYKLRVVTPTGQLEEVSVDAMTGEIMQNGDD